MTERSSTVVPTDVWYDPHDGTWNGICPACETSVTENMTECPLCGAKLDWEGEE